MFYSGIGSIPTTREKGLSRRSLLVGAASGGALTVSALARARFVAAQEASPEAVDGPPPLPEGCELLATGLVNPRFLVVAEDGSVYVTEAGLGGDEDVFFAPGEEAASEGMASPEAMAPLGTRGATGQVSKIAPDGTVSVVATGLGSYLFGGIEALGPAGIAVSGGQIWVAVGGPGPVPENHAPLDTEGHVLAIDEATGEFSSVANILAYEIENNPEDFVVDSDLYGMTLGADGLLYVADAGGNVIYSVDPATGDISVVAVIPGIPVPEEEAPPGGNPARGGANELDPVPTSVTSGTEGELFISLLSGGPFPPGAAKIQSIDATGIVSDAAGGLTMATDVKIGPDGQMYAVQISLDFLQEVPAPGNVVRVLANGEYEVVIPDLILPNGIDFDAEGNLYVALGTVTPPGSDPIGMVLRCNGVAPPA